MQFKKIFWFGKKYQTIIFSHLKGQMRVPPGEKCAYMSDTSVLLYEMCSANVLKSANSEHVKNQSIWFFVSLIWIFSASRTYKNGTTIRFCRLSKRCKEQCWQKEIAQTEEAEKIKKRCRAFRTKGNFTKGNHYVHFLHWSTYFAIKWGKYRNSGANWGETKNVLKFP